MLFGLAGCQNKIPSNLPQQKISQLRVIVPGEGFYQITRKEWEENGLKIQDPDQIRLLYQGESHPFWTQVDPETNDLTIRFYSPPISPNINLSENVFILTEGQIDPNRRIIPHKAPPDQSNFQINSNGLFLDKYEQQYLYLPQVSGEDHWLWALFQPNQPIEQEIHLPQESVDSVMMRVRVWISPTNVQNPA